MELQYTMKEGGKAARGKKGGRVGSNYTTKEMGKSGSAPCNCYMSEKKSDLPQLSSGEGQRNCTHSVVLSLVLKG